MGRLGIRIVLVLEVTLVPRVTKLVLWFTILTMVMWLRENVALWTPPIDLRIAPIVALNFRAHRAFTTLPLTALGTATAGTF